MYTNTNQKASAQSLDFILVCVIEIGVFMIHFYDENARTRIIRTENWRTGAWYLFVLARLLTLCTLHITNNQKSADCECMLPLLLGGPDRGPHVKVLLVV